MDWEKFIQFYGEKYPSTVIVPLLKLSAFTEERPNEVVVTCKNLGAKIFLDGKRPEIDAQLTEFMGKPMKVIFLVAPKEKSSQKRKEPEQTLPILEFQNNTEERIKKASLQPLHTFDNFAVSTTNHIAHAAALSVAENPGDTYNPLFIYGDVGVGKTHLSQAIGNYVIEQNPGKKVLYCTSEQFTNDLIDNIRVKNTKEFRKKYRDIDMLIVDDVQFIAGKSYIQEEFYHTFNSIVQRGGQIIMTSDKPPKEIKELEDRLRSRFTGGLIIDVQKPNFELRTAILLIKARERNIQIDMPAAQHIAENIDDSRELEGALLKMMSIKILSGSSSSITVDEISRELTKQHEVLRSRATPQDIIRAVATYYDIKPSDIKGPSRKENLAFARQVCMYLLKSVLDIKLDDIAYILKRKDHTTIMHGQKKIAHELLHNESFKEEVDRISKSIL